MCIDDLLEINTLDTRHKIVEYQPLGDHIDVLMETRIENGVFRVAMMKKTLKEMWMLSVPIDDLLGGDYTCYVDEHEEEHFEGYCYSIEITKKHRMLFSKNYDKEYFCAKELGRKIWEVLNKIGFDVEMISAEG